METVRVTATGMNIGLRVYSYGDLVAVPTTLAAQLVAEGSAVRVMPEKPAGRRERAVKAGRETR